MQTNYRSPKRCHCVMFEFFKMATKSSGNTGVHISKVNVFVSLYFLHHQGHKSSAHSPTFGVEFCCLGSAIGNPAALNPDSDSELRISKFNFSRSAPKGVRLSTKWRREPQFEERKNIEKLKSVTPNNKQ